VSDTPRTDAAVALTSQHRYDDSFGDPIFGWVTANFARQLERENAALRADKERLDWLLSNKGSRWFGDLKHYALPVDREDIDAAQDHFRDAARKENNS